MVDIRSGEQYVPLFKWHKDLPKEQHFLCFDQAKTNLFYLMEPRIDTEGLDAAWDNPMAEDVDKYMDAKTREAVTGLPLPFMAYWLKIYDSGVALAQSTPPNILTTMMGRARKTQARLLGLVEEGSVVRVNFRRRG